MSLEFNYRQHMIYIPGEDKIVSVNGKKVHIKSYVNAELWCNIALRDLKDDSKV